jgi:hypothetical protein
MNFGNYHLRTPFCGNAIGQLVRPYENPAILLASTNDLQYSDLVEII